jgi:hypothetical protein
MVMQELQASFPGFAGVPTWTTVADDPPDLVGVSQDGQVGLELVEWLDGEQMGSAQARKTYREKLWELIAGGWNTAYQPSYLSSAVVCPRWGIKIANGRGRSYLADESGAGW